MSTSPRIILSKALGVPPSALSSYYARIVSGTLVRGVVGGESLLVVSVNGSVWNKTLPVSSVVFVGAIGTSIIDSRTPYGVALELHHPAVSAIPYRPELLPYYAKKCHEWEDDVCENPQYIAVSRDAYLHEFFGRKTLEYFQRQVGTPDAAVVVTEEGLGSVWAPLGVVDSE